MAHGRLVTRIGNAAALSGADALASALVSALFGGSISSVGGAPSTPPQSISALRSAFAENGHYDGLLVTFGKRHAQHALHDAQLLLSGRVKLVFRVSR
jgi:hypothetical protein